MRAVAQCGAGAVGAAWRCRGVAALGEAGTYPDLIVADYRLAGGELGTDVIARLRHELGLQIPALLVSGDASAEAFAAMRGCALDVLLKPVLPEALRVLVERLLARDAGPPAGSVVRAA
jgi:CheY-like chemotaxis protein